MQKNREQQVLVSLAGVQTKIGLSEQIRLRPMSVNDSAHRRESVSSASLLRTRLGKPKASADRTEFWHLWQQYRAYHYSRCLQWMGGNSHDAEESLSQAMFKAWNKWPYYTDKIANPKAWLTRLIHNHCMDIHRKAKREAQKMENIDDIKFAEHLPVTSSLESPESDISRREMRTYLHQAIAALPPRLRDPFILRYCQDKSYKEIAKQLALSEENVWKRVQQARTILRSRLNNYLAGENDTSLDSLLPQLKSLIPTLEESKPEKTAIFNWEASITTTIIIEEINYKLTVICLQTLPHTWYSSPSLQGWK
jgi:RNA polymerase sigma factor (sigma-70 family)